MAFGVEPINDPNWLGWSKSVQKPTPDVSGEILGRTIGKSLEDAGEVTSKIAEGQFQQGAEDILRNQMGIVTGLNDAVHGQVSPESLLGARGQADDNIPVDVQKVSQVANTLESARKNGSISSTYYYGQLDKYASDMRSKYPMFAQQIDKGIAKATGVTNTANELYQSTLRDLNSFLSKKDDGLNKVISEISSNMGSGPANGASNAADAIAKLRSGEWTVDDGYRYVNSIQSRQYQLKNLNEELTVSDSLGKNQSLMAQRTFIAEGDNFINNAVHAATDKFGFKNVGEMEYAMQHPEEFSSVDMQAVATAYAGLEVNLRKGLDRIANTMHTVINPQTGQKEVWSWAQLHPNYQTDIENRLKTYQAGLNFIKDKDAGGLTYWTRMQSAASQDVTTQLLSQEHGIGPTPLVMDALKKLGMDQYVQKLTQDSMKDNLLPKLKAFVGSVQGRSWMTPGQAKANNMSPAVSLQDDISAFIDKYGVKSPKVFNRLVEDLHGISQNKIPDEQKAAKILYAFGPKNSQVLNTWQRNGLQPDGSVSDAPDRWNILGAMLDPKITQEVRRLDSDPRFKKYMLWDTFKSTANSMIREQFQKQLLDLDPMNAGRNITFDTDKNEFKYNPPANRSGVRPGNLPEEKLINKINIGMHAMKDIADAEGSQPAAYIYKMMVDMGYKGFDEGIKTTGQGMMNSVIATHAAERKAYEDMKKQMIEESSKLGKKNNQ